MLTIIIAASIIGIFLGLVGGGGSLLTVPVLVYQLNIDPILATAYSLFVVGVSAAFGAVTYYRKNLFDLKLAIIFSIPAIISVYSTRLWLLPSIPDPIFTIEALDFSLTKPSGIMLLFTAMMFMAAYAMLFGKNKSITTDSSDHKLNFGLIGVEGFLVGILTGLVGAGGGFLIVPVLVALAHIEIKKAVGVSLFIISVKSLFGFIGDVQVNQNIDWIFLFQFSSFMVVGIFLGSYLTKFFSDRLLKKIFGFFIVVIAIYIFKKELF